MRVKRVIATSVFRRPDLKHALSSPPSLFQMSGHETSCIGISVLNTLSLFWRSALLKQIGSDFQTELN